MPSSAKAASTFVRSERFVESTKPMPLGRLKTTVSVIKVTTANSTKILTRVPTTASGSTL